MSEGTDQPKPQSTFPAIPNGASSPPTALQSAFPAIPNGASSPPTALQTASIAPPAAQKASRGSRTVTVALGCALLGTLVGTVAGYALHKPPVVGRNFWNFDNESMPEGTIGEGWEGNEGAPGSITFRWCGAVKCMLTLVVGEDIAGTDKNVLMRIRTWPHRYEGATTPQSISVEVNGEVVGERVMQEVPYTEVFPVKPGTLQPGPNEIALGFTYAKTPKETGVNPSDDRKLSAAVDWIELEPVK